MGSEPPQIWFWQTEVTPHMAGLVSVLANLGCEVMYVANQTVSTGRATQGWIQPSMGSARLELAPTAQATRELAEAAPLDSVHVIQGLRGHGLVGEAQCVLMRRDLRLWVVMESVDDEGWRGVFRRLEYDRLVWRLRGNLQGILATGYRTPDWIVARGMPVDRVFPFAYFLSDMAVSSPIYRPLDGRYRIIFVGQCIRRKRLDLLVEAIKQLSVDDVELTVIGSGPLENEWRSMAEAALPGRVHWLGRLAMNEVTSYMIAADCLVLPSRHDGWGAVVSEALMVGTPAICSDACGVAGVVRESGYGSVFPVGDVDALVRCLERMCSRGSLGNQARRELASWARCLGANAGADYLSRIFAYSEGSAQRPRPPWESIVNRSISLPVCSDGI